MIRCLGRFVPSRLDGPVIASELRSWLMSINIEPREPQIGVRTPDDTARACRATPVLMEWHRDGTAEPTGVDETPSIRTLVVWSNKSSTRLRMGVDGYELLHGICQVIMFDNIHVWHRSPPIEDGRWFAGIADPKVSAIEP